MQQKGIKYLGSRTIHISPNLKKLIGYILIYLISFIFVSCEAPRSNPLDPMNEANENTVSIIGTVFTLSVPFTPLENVSVIWIPENAPGAFQQTNIDGYFAVPNIERKNGKLIFLKEGYWPDTLLITWNQERSKTQTVNLNKLPVLDSASIYTKVWNNSSIEVSSELYISAGISDDEMDIDSAYVIIPGLQIQKTMGYNTTSRAYEIGFTPEDLGLDNLEKIIGQNFNIYVADVEGTHLVGSENPSRVIVDYVTLISPVNGSIVDSLPEFQWEPYRSGYPFFYSLEIYTNDIAQLLVQRIDYINPEITSYKLTEPLTSKEYKWVVWINDDLKNQSMSIPLTFIVP